MDDVPYEQRLLPAIIDHRAEHTPERTFAYLPKSETTVHDGFNAVNYRQLAKAVDAAAWWMDTTLGPAAAGYPPFPYVGLDDLRYVILGFAALKTSRTFMIPFSGNTDAGMAKLLKAADSKIVAAPKALSHVWDHAIANLPHLKLIEVPDQGYFLHDRPGKVYPYGKTLSQAIDEPAFLFQTSGTTGDPQLIRWGNRRLHDVYNNMDQSNRAAPDLRLVQYELMRNCYRPNTIPLSWGAGYGFCAWWPIFTGSVPILLPASWKCPPSPQQIYETIQVAPRGPVNGLFFIPDVLRQFCRDSARLQSLRSFDWIGYGGAPLDHETGDLVWNQGVRVQSLPGSTDSDTYPYVMNEPADWNIHRFYPDFDGFHLQPFLEGEGLYELCISRQPQDERHCFKTVPERTVFHTRDLFQKVPDREGFWTTAGRVDDYVKLASLTKFNAIEIERQLDGHPDIEGALVDGHGRERPFVILQVAQTLVGDGKDQILDQVWSVFEQVNKNTYKDAHLCKELTMLTEPGMPLKRTAKGTLDRRYTIAMYQEKIEEMYSSANGK